MQKKYIYVCIFFLNDDLKKGMLVKTKEYTRIIFRVLIFFIFISWFVKYSHARMVY